ncbi:cadherin-like beta sandwich domain-containing protein [Paenibacillus thalictri]|uniref:SLH domain-containing protein n=1 Tax=Paenibacillus thalictri TaxID=2527873 RepID=A0A4Q9DDQ2_9BACL|nr:cadherin-like beta sandwich domain-containing protein [Paenibacillus thalictri]TBL69305.1 hypothetical protein EYB31_36195 [Paenibacillus thalictri]
MTGRRFMLERCGLSGGKLALILILMALCALRFPSSTHADEMVWKPLTDEYLSDTDSYDNQIIADDGILYMSYREKISTGKYKPTVKKYDGNNWSIVSGGPASPGAVSVMHMALDPSDKALYVAYRDEENGGKASIVKLTNNQWEPLGQYGFTPKGVYALSMTAFNGTPYIVYGDYNKSNKLTVMKYTNNGWSPVGQEGFTDKRPADGTKSLIKVVGHIVYVAYKRDLGSSNVDMVVMKYDEDRPSDGWQLVGDAGAPLLSTADANSYYYAFDVYGGIPYLAYQDHDADKLVVLKYDGNWKTIGNGPVSAGKANYPSLSFDNGSLYIAFQDGANGNKLMVKRFNGSDWTMVGNAAITRGEVYYPSISVYNGTIYVGYQDDDTLLTTKIAKARAFVITYGSPLSAPLPGDIQVPYGTAKADALPATVSMKWTDDTTTPAAVTWDQGNPPYNSKAPATYIFKGQLTIPSGKQNTGVREVTVKVIVANPSHDTALSDLTTDAGALTPVFAAGTKSYSRNVANEVSQISVTASLYDPKGTVTIGGAAAANGVPSSPISLRVGLNNIDVIVTAEDGMTTDHYTINVSREGSNNTALSDLTTDAGVLTPLFAVGTTAYSQTVAHSVYSLSVTASVYEPNATLKIAGVPTPSGVPSAALPLQVGANTIAVDVTAADGVTTGSYTINVTRKPSSNADLADLTTTAGTISPSFFRETTSYEAIVPFGAQSVTVTASVYDAAASLSINGTATVSGTASAAIPLQIGLNRIQVKVLAEDGVTEKLYTLQLTRLPSSSSGSGGAPVSSSTDNGTQAQPAAGVDIILDGVSQSSFATAETVQTDAGTTVIVTLDEQKLLDMLDKKTNNVITIPITSKADVVVGRLNGQLVKALTAKETVIEVKTDGALYILPAAFLDISHVAAALHADNDLQHIVVSIKISETSKDKADLVRAAAAGEGMTVVANPLDFEIEAQYGENKITVSRFPGFVERAVAVPAGIDVSGATTGVVIGPDGRLTPVPTRIEVRSGKTYAVINSLTNSTYALVQGEKSFADLSGHWSQSDVNEMASRLVVDGVAKDRFAPDLSITRAEFATIMVRALGLKPDDGRHAFSDVYAADWYADSVAAASATGLLGGYEDGSFRPNQTITRSEASVLLTRALAFAKIHMQMSADEADKQLSAYTDADGVAEWAKVSLALAVKNGIIQGDGQRITPEDPVTRAQTAVMIKRLLQQAGLIDKINK